MSFTGALIIILAVALVGLALLCHNLFSRLHLLEQAVAGGMRAPSRLLAREEFTRRFAVAQARASLAREIGTGLVLFLDDGTASSEIVDVLQHLKTGRAITIMTPGTAPQPVADLNVRFEIRDGVAPSLERWGVVALPFAVIVDDGTIVRDQPLSGASGLDTLLLEVA